MSDETTSLCSRKNKTHYLKHRILKNYQLYLLVILPVVYILIFKYYPMWGAQIAFRDYQLGQSYSDGKFVGLTHFIRFVKSPIFPTLMKNTILLNLYNMVFSFPIPIIMALALQYCRSRRYAKAVQLTIYIPHFISTVVIIGLLATILNIRTGIVNVLIANTGGKTVDFFGRPEYFRLLYVLTGIWQGCGWNSIIYISALSGVDPQIHESAVIDGASILQRIWYVDLPSILPTMVMLLIMQMGSFFKTGFEKAYLMQNTLNLSVSEVIDTYVYKMGLASQGANFSYSTAIGLFQSVVGFILIMFTNWLSRKLTENSLW